MKNTLESSVAEEELNKKMNERPKPKVGEIKNLVYSCQIDRHGENINVVGWKVEGSKKPPLILAHDIGETTERYTALAESLAEAGYSVYTFDMRGHGKNSKKIGEIPSFSLLVKDLLQVIALIKHKEEGRKPIVIARGMGALIALTFTRAHSKFARGIVFASPMFNLNYNLTPMRRFFIRSVAEIAPSMSLPSWLSPTFTNASQETYIMDPNKAHPKMNSHFTFELLNSIAQSKKLLKRLNLPALFICPAKDPALRYEFLKPIVQKHSHVEKFTLKYVKGEDNLPLEHGGNTLKYLSKTIVKWLEELDGPSAQETQENQTTENAETKTTPTAVVNSRVSAKENGISENTPEAKTETKSAAPEKLEKPEKKGAVIVVETTDDIAEEVSDTPEPPTQVKKNKPDPLPEN